MKKVLFFLTFLSLFAFSQGRNVQSVKAYSSSDWTIVKTNGDYSSYWKINSDSIVGTNIETGSSNFLISNTLEASGDYSITVNLQGTMGFPNTKETQAGIIPWYVDDNNYVMVYLQWRATNRPNELNQVQVTGRIDGEFLSIWKDPWDNTSEWNDWWTDGNTTASNTNIKFTVDRHFENGDAYRYKFYINDVYIGEHGIKGDMASAKKAGKMGLYSYNDTFTFTNFTKSESTSSGGSSSGGESSGGSSSSGDSENVETKGDYEFVSPSGTNCWTLNADNSVTGSGENGTTWLRTSALKANTEGKKNFFMSSTMQVDTLRPVTGANIEYKVGLCPYYLDTNNYVFVWLSRWSDCTLAECIVTAKVNGTVIGSSDWISSDWLGFDITAKCELGVEINDDALRVYLNNQTQNPDMNLVLEGLSNRTITNSKAGFNIVNVKATFSSNSFYLDERVFIEKPVISVAGTKVTSGVINQSISLPIFSATNSYGHIMETVTTVTDPDNEPVTLSRNKFTPTKIGTYKVKVTCTDSYGNEADPVEYSIVITDTITNNGNGTDNKDLFNSQLGIDTSNGVTIASTFVGGGAVLSVLGIAINIILKKKLF